MATTAAIMVNPGLSCAARWNIEAAFHGGNRSLSLCADEGIDRLPHIVDDRSDRAWKERMEQRPHTKPQGAPAMAALERALRSLRGSMDLLAPSNHPAAAVRERTDLITRRVRLIAGIFAVLTLAWTPIDAYTIRWPYWGEVMLGRVVAAALFAGLALRPGHWPRFNATLEVTLLVAIPLGFFLYTNNVLSISGYFGGAGGMLAVTTAYFFLPFLVAAGLGIFPLTASEAVLPAGLAIGAMALAVELWPQFLGGQSGLATIWRIVLIAGIATLAGMSQLRFLLRLTAAAMRDGLTGLLARRVGEELLDNQFAYAKRQDLPFALLFIDLDRFKSINDQFGHKAGDDVLSNTGRVFAQVFRRQDVAIRWGGEEFVVGLPGTDAASAEIIAHRLGEIGLGQRPDGLPVTASIGIAERKSDGIDRLRALTELADSRMYQAKQAGRNRVCFRGEPQLWRRQAGV
jgi:diguanylate cyclase (GGDEF)-like protein